MSQGELPPNLIAATADGGQIAGNIVEFARILRAAGLPIGPDRTVLATRAVLVAGLANLPVFHAALRTALVSRADQHEIFDEAFRLCWKEPGSLAASDQDTGIEDRSTHTERELSRRLMESLLAGHKQPTQREERVEIDARETFSGDELLRRKDFEQMSADELRKARRILATIPVLREEITTRRFRTARQGEQIDLREILRQMAAKGPGHLAIVRKARVHRPVPLVVLIDISGSMDTYARMMLHFLYALTNQRRRVHTFLFATRLTNITRHLTGRDPDRAIDKVASKVEDWAGGTRIGEAIATFNRLWGRRVLGQNATVLLITDGLDRDGGDGLALATRRLRASCRRLVWLNPLLRYDGYQPLARGARELIKYASDVRTCHNLASLQDLATALGGNRGHKTWIRNMPDRIARLHV